MSEKHSQRSADLPALFTPPPAPSNRAVLAARSRREFLRDGLSALALLAAATPLAARTGAVPTVAEQGAAGHWQVSPGGWDAAFLEHWYSVQSREV